jgi:hypothetical protein
MAVDYIASFLGRLTSEEAQQRYERYIGPYFASDGRVDPNVARHAVDEVATELGIPAANVAAQPLTRCTCRPCDRAATSRRRRRLDPQGPPCLFLAPFGRLGHCSKSSAICGTAAVMATFSERQPQIVAPSSGQAAPDLWSR